MKKLILFFILSFVHDIRAQSLTDAAVQLSATVQQIPPAITLHWPGNATTTQYQVFRKAKSGVSWGPVFALLPGNTTQYTDNAVSAGINYEYKLVRTGNNYTGFGYIISGIGIPETDFRGKVILIVDSTFSSPLAVELKRLVEDMEGDGWEVLREDVDRNGSVAHVKSLIKSHYLSDVPNTKAVFLLGHVPVPYSGNLNPDAHPDHLGAWPADVYYGDMDGNWTDVSGPTTSASPLRTQNLPGDGKFDQSLVPGDVELQVGRVDLSSMSSFSAIGNEEQLLRNYLDKDHAYRKKLFVAQNQAVIDDNFGYFSAEAFAASGYKNFAVLVGAGNIAAADYISSLNTGSYKWSYGCGGGSFTSASGIGNTSAIAAATLQGVFTVLFGSYFGDWDVPNNFLRAPLASGSMLTNVWSGRPHFQFHHMGLGENIGYSLLMTQNHAGGLYFASPFNISGKWVHCALMGDPTLRNDVVAPVSNVVATKAGNDCHITWSASSEPAISGYNIYMKNDTNNVYVKLNATPLAGTSYTDPCLQYKGVYKYLVRTLKLETTSSGSYYNMSEGISDTALNTNNNIVSAAFSAAISGNTVNLLNTSINANAYKWQPGNGTSSTSTNTSATYSANGHYTVKLIASGTCRTDSAVQVIKICNWPAVAAFKSRFSNDTLYLINNSKNADTFLWYSGNGQISNQTVPPGTHTFGNYTVMLIATNICGSDSTVMMIPHSKSGLTENSGASVNIFPNPVSGLLHIESTELRGLSVFNSLGQKVYDNDRPGQMTTVDVSGFTDGFYVILLRSAQKTWHRKFQKN